MHQPTIYGAFVTLILSLSACATSRYPLFDQDGDGIPAYVDCDDLAPDVGSKYLDEDGDGHGAQDALIGCLASDLGNAVLSSDDCDDGNEAVYPGAAELCDGLDNNCDEVIDAGNNLAGGEAFYGDTDHDGFGDPQDIPVLACSSNPPEGRVANDSDCDDSVPNINPNAAEICDDIDNDCNDLTDAEDEGVEDASTYFLDVDQDGYGGSSSSTLSCESEVPSGYSEEGSDCDDSDGAVYPGAIERCNAVDDNCDGIAEDRTDSDGDGYERCALDLEQDDCDDSDANVHPMAAEGQEESVSLNCLMADSLDNDCDGLTDEGTCASDDDGDGTSELEGDCDDDDGLLSPDALEVCDTIDNDCDGLIDDEDSDTSDQLTYYQDLDEDGVGTLETTLKTCAVIAPVGYTDHLLDCDDSRSDVNPGMPELCDGLDNDCDPATPEEGDGDGDGYPACDGSVQVDCQDARADIYPGAVELCDGEDGDCDGAVDDGLPLQDFYRDEDRDGYGNKDLVESGCVAPDGHVENSTDCDDTLQTVYPGAEEVCDGTDNDCDGQSDEGLERLWYRDMDGDTYGVETDTIFSCSGPVGYVSQSQDCDDTNESAHPMLVDPRVGSDNGTGTSDSPLSRIQQAVDSSNSCGLVLLASGTYRESVSISGKKQLTVKGTGLADETRWLGAEGNRALEILGGNEVTIQNLSVTSEDIVTGDGGGIRIEDSVDFVLSHLIIRDNVATGDASLGGGVAVLGGYGVIEDSSFLNSQATFGGGLAVAGGLVEVHACQFGGDGVGNRADDSGAGLWVGERTESNEVGVALVDASSFISNRASESGGAAYAEKGSALEVVDSTLYANSILQGDGGALYNPRLVERCVLRENVAVGDNASGGGGVMLVSQAELWNNIFLGNRARLGGAISIKSDPISPEDYRLYHNTFVYDSAEEMEGTVIKIDSANYFEFINNILVAEGSDPSVAIKSTLGRNFKVQYNDTWVTAGTVYKGSPSFNDGLLGVDGNFSLDPKFVQWTPSDFSTADVHLSESSPCRDSGSEVDANFDGNPDFLDAADGTRADLGAYGGPRGVWPD